MHFISRRQLFAAFLAATLLVGTTVSASARVIDGVVVFGDSLSDDGNASAAAAALGGTFPNPAFYAGGALSNGPVWVEGFAAALGVPLDNRAFAGAYTDTRNTGSSFLPTAQGIETEVALYLGANNPVDSNDLFVVWGGANDLFQLALGNSATPPTVSAQNIGTRINSLIGAGARQFLIPNLPNLGNTPGGAAAGPVGVQFLNNSTAVFNTALSAQLAQISQNNPLVSIKTLDINLLFTQIITNGGAFGFTNVADNYLTSNGGPQGVNPSITAAGQAAGSPSGFLFYDEIHPTAKSHEFIAQRALAVVVPEGSTVGLMGAGCSLLGVGIVLRRRRKA